MAGPITVADYYRVRWRALDTFIDLFERNPARSDSGRLAQMPATTR